MPHGVELGPALTFLANGQSVKHLLVGQGEGRTGPHLPLPLLELASCACGELVEESSRSGADLARRQTFSLDGEEAGGRFVGEVVDGFLLSVDDGEGVDRC
eukprot:3195900-Rhodomonas_salina.1